IHDRVIFEARLTGQGYKDVTVPVVLKFKDKDGKEKELSREHVKIDASGKSVKVRLVHRPAEAGRKVFYIEGQPRYEYRFVKSLLERENQDAKKNKSVDLRVLLLDADPDFARTD